MPLNLQESARQIRALILELKQKGTTIFLTTHHIEDAQRLCDRIAFIVDGRIVKTGTVNELMQNAEQKHIVRLTLSESMKKTENCFQRAFPAYRIEAQGEKSCLIRQICLMFPKMPVNHDSLHLLSRREE